MHRKSRPQGPAPDFEQRVRALVLVPQHYRQYAIGRVSIFGAGAKVGALLVIVDLEKELVAIDYKRPEVVLAIRIILVVECSERADHHERPYRQNPGRVLQHRVLP